jgi:GT2 family glycosyltransferase
MTETAIVILNWNGIGFLKMFLGKVVKHSNLPDTRIIVADNNSSDGSTEWIENQFNNIEIIKLDKNYGLVVIS